ncbi:MAG: hypothetical protein ACRDM1_09950 [Gaiellaceae bacterium]
MPFDLAADRSDSFIQELRRGDEQLDVAARRIQVHERRESVDDRRRVTSGPHLQLADEVTGDGIDRRMELTMRRTNRRL